jgi:ribosomal protein S18 acetylase RimI-like enzyme
LAIIKEYRQYGFGKVLVEKLEEEAAKAGTEGRAPAQDGKVTIKSHSQVCAIPLSHSAT